MPRFAMLPDSSRCLVRCAARRFVYALPEHAEQRQQIREHRQLLLQLALTLAFVVVECRPLCCERSVALSTNVGTRG
jgi:hypothetical protein